MDQCLAQPVLNLVFVFSDALDVVHDPAEPPHRVGCLKGLLHRVEACVLAQQKAAPVPGEAVRDLSGHARHMRADADKCQRPGGREAGGKPTGGSPCDQIVFQNAGEPAIFSLFDQAHEVVDLVHQRGGRAGDSNPEDGYCSSARS